MAPKIKRFPPKPFFVTFNKKSYITDAKPVKSLKDFKELIVTDDGTNVF